MNKQPWEGFPEIWSTKSKFMTYLRGGFRKSLWARNPVKIEYIRSKRFKAPIGRKEKMVWACECEICGKTFKQSECEVDHIEEAGRLIDIEDIQLFVESLALVGFEDIQILDKACHRIKSHSSRKGISFEAARLEKLIIELTKREDIKRVLIDQFGCSPEEVSNSGKRKRVIAQLVAAGIIE